MNPARCYQIASHILALVFFSSLCSLSYGDFQNFTWQNKHSLDTDHGTESSISDINVIIKKEPDGACHGNIKILSGLLLVSHLQYVWTSGIMAEDRRVYWELTDKNNESWMKIAADGNKEQILHASFPNSDAVVESNRSLDGTSRMWRLKLKPKEDKEKLVELRVTIGEVSMDASEMALVTGEVEDVNTVALSPKSIMKIDLKTDKKLTKILDTTLIHKNIIDGYSKELLSNIPFLDQKLQATITQIFQKSHNSTKISAKLLNDNASMDLRGEYDFEKIDTEIENIDEIDHNGASKWHDQETTNHGGIQDTSCGGVEKDGTLQTSCPQLQQEQFINHTLRTPHHHFHGEMTKEVFPSGDHVIWIYEKATSEWNTLSYTLKQVFNFSSSGSGWETMLRKSPWSTIFVQATWGSSYLEAYDKTFSFYFDQMSSIPTTLLLLNFQDYNDFDIRFKFPTLAWQLGISLEINEENTIIKVEELDLHWPDDPVEILSLTILSQDNDDWLIQWHSNMYKLQQYWQSLYKTLSRVWEALIKEEGKYGTHPFKTIIEGVVGHPLEVFMEKLYLPGQLINEQLHNIDDFGKIVETLTVNIGVPPIEMVERWCEKIGLQIDLVHNTATLSMAKWSQTQSELQILFEKLLSGSWQHCEDMIALADMIKNIFII